MCTHTGPFDGRLPCTNTDPTHDPDGVSGHTYELGTHPHAPKEDT